MKTKVFLLAAAVFALILAGCGGNDHHGPSPIVTDIISEGGTNDGDITFTGGVYSVFTSNQAPNTVRVDLEPGLETRGFITFSLATIPTTASIQRATVFLPIFDVIPIGLGTSVSLEPDMVTFSPLDTLTTQLNMANTFDTIPILSRPSFPVFLSDVGHDVAFDATGAVIEANSPPALSSLQIRLISVGGLVEIDDLLNTTTGAGTPLLRVEYF